MKITLPLPPSANNYWRVFRGVTVVSPEARTYKANVKFRAMQQAADGRVCPLAGEVVANVVVYRKRRVGDLDNFLKVLLDSLKGVAFEDDSQVVEIHARREDDPSNPRVVVQVEEVRP